MAVLFPIPRISGRLFALDITSASDGETLHLLRPSLIDNLCRRPTPGCSDFTEPQANEWDFTHRTPTCGIPLCVGFCFSSRWGFKSKRDVIEMRLKLGC